MCCVIHVVKPRVHMCCPDTVPRHPAPVVLAGTSWAGLSADSQAVKSALLMSDPLRSLRQAELLSACVMAPEHQSPNGCCQVCLLRHCFAVQAKHATVVAQVLGDLQTLQEQVSQEREAAAALECGLQAQIQELAVQATAAREEASSLQAQLGGMLACLRPAPEHSLVAWECMCVCSEPCLQQPASGHILLWPASIGLSWSCYVLCNKALVFEVHAKPLICLSGACMQA